MDHTFFYSQNGTFGAQERRLLGFADSADTPKPPAVEDADKAKDTADQTKEQPEKMDTPQDIIRNAGKRAEKAQKDIAALNGKIQELQFALNTLNAEAQGETQESADGEKEQGPAPQVMDIDALFAKYKIEIKSGEKDTDALTRVLNESTQERDQKAEERNKAEGERKQAEEDLMQNMSPEDRIGVRVNQLMRAKSLPEFISGALKAFAETKMFFASIKQQIKDGIFGPDRTKGGPGSPDAPKKEDPLTKEIRKKGAAKTIEEATAVKTAAETALNDTNTGLNKQKTDLTSKKTELTTAISSQESALATMPDGEEKTKAEDTLKTAKADLKTIDEKIAQVDTDIAKQNAIIEGADKKLARVTEMKTATEQTRGKLETMSTAMIQTIDNSDMKDKPEGKAIRNMLDGTKYEADGLSIAILDTNDAEITEAKGSLTKLALDPTALNVEKRGDKTYIKDPSKFADVLEKLTGQLNRDNSIKTLGLAKSSDGKGYVREGYSGKYFPQADGSIFYEGGMKGGKKVEPNTYVDGKWNDVRTPNADTAKLVESSKAEGEAAIKEKCGKAIKELNLVQSADGKSYIREGGYTGKYFAQADGSIFYEGGKKPDGKDAPAQTYVDGKWDQARTTPLPGVDVAAKASPAEAAKPKNPTDAINAAKQELKLQVARGGVLTRPGYTGRYFAQKDGSIFYEGGVGPSKKTLGPTTYVDGKWDPTRNTRLA